MDTSVGYSRNGILLSNKKGPVAAYATTRMSLRLILLSEGSQMQKHTYSMIPFIKVLAECCGFLNDCIHQQSISNFTAQMDPVYCTYVICNKVFFSLDEFEVVRICLPTQP